MKRTYQPSNLVRKRRHGFRARMATKAGRKILNARRARAAFTKSDRFLRTVKETGAQTDAARGVFPGCFSPSTGSSGGVMFKT